MPEMAIETVRLRLLPYAPGDLLALIDGAAEPGRPRDEYYERHRMPAQTEREDAERNGFRFVRERPGFTRTDDKKEYYFMIFEKPAKTT